ncbi:MAG: RagB/SusD family nutrient uptake outer membrane protein [Ferruginibacter sp.]
MKNKTKIYIIIVCVAIISATGCSKKFLDQFPSDSVAQHQELSTITGLQDVLSGAYASLRATNFYGRSFPVVGDLQADNSYVEITNSGLYIPQYTYNVVNNDPIAAGIWSFGYSSISAVNQIIDADVTSPGVLQIKAEAYALRALVYFKLVNYYARPYTDNPNALGVPLVIHFSPSLFPARNKVSEVYAQIVSDLKTAVAGAAPYSTSIRLSKYAIEALLAKVYLYMGDNTNAKTAAVDVINNSGFTLVSASAYAGFWSNTAPRKDAVETMFEVDVSATENNGFNDLGAIYKNGFQDIYASSQLYNLYSATDVRRALLIPGTTKSGAAAYLVNKYPDALNTDKDNVRVMRLSEVYLIAAEASLPNSEADARTYLNALVAKRDPGFAGYTSTGAALLTDIVTERRKELAFEGDRLFDMNRLKQDISRSANPGAIQAGTGNVNLVIPYSSYLRIAPIPLSETTANANIASQQNPGY